MNNPYPIPEASSRRANRAYIPVRLQQTASMTPPPPYVPLPPAGAVAGASGANQALPQAQGLYPAPHPQGYPQFLLPGHDTQHVDPTQLHVPTHQQAFGPTPISTSLPLLPYGFYESSGAAAARARWRFVSAVMVALGIYLFVAAVVGLELLGEMAGS
jgi:hypothetical protein